MARSGRKISRGRILAGIGTCSVAAGLSVLVTLFTLPNVVPGATRATMANLPVIVSPDARAAAAAIALVKDQDEATLQRSEILAKQAVHDDPLAVSAIRTLALIAAYRKDDERSLKLLRYGESLSKRDLMTELAIAFDARRVEGNMEAIRHYGHALGTTRRGYELIVDQVVTAAQDLDFARDLGTAMAADPTWRDRFLPFYFARVEDPVSLAATIDAMWADGVPVADRPFANRALNLLLQKGAQDEAASLLTRVLGKNAARVRDGGFEQGEKVAFGWDLESGSSFSGLPVPREDGEGKMLEMRASSGYAGAIAKQILSLAPGEYRLSAELWADENADEGMPRVILRCAGVDLGLADLRNNGATAGKSTGPIATGFSVPAECPVQYLEVKFGSSLFVSSSRGWADGIAIDPA